MEKEEGMSFANSLVFGTVWRRFHSKLKRCVIELLMVCDNFYLEDLLELNERNMIVHKRYKADTVL